MHRAAACLLGLSCLIAAPPSPAQPVFADGFEPPCSVLDADQDRLSGCHEALLLTDPADADTDGDGLGDGDEVLGTLAGLDLPAMGVDPRRKDVLLEYDWYDDALETGASAHCPPGGHSHRPTAAMLDIVTAMFAQAPVGNPDGSSGVNVIHDYGQGGVFSGGSVVEDAQGDGIVLGHVFHPEYDLHYQTHFEPARVGYFHYVLMAHGWMDFDDLTPGGSGAAEIGGLFTDEMLVTLGCKRSDRNVGFTIAHELGHNLGLMHGGDTACNRKPSYNSIMNYSYMFAGVDRDCDGTVVAGPADFSRGLFLPLDEADLDEARGLCGIAPFDWNGTNGIEASVQRNLNPYEDEILECGGTHTVLADFNDWAAIRLRIEMPSGGGAPAPVSATCPGPPQECEMRWFFALLFAAFAVTDVSAQRAYSFTPNPATTLDEIRVRVDTLSCYDRNIVVEVDAMARSITGRTHVGDLPCDPTNPAHFVTPRFFPVGRLPAGTYQARLVSCVDFSPTPGCFTVFHEETVVVRGVSAAPFTIPAASPGMLAWLAIAAVAGAGWGWRRAGR